MDTAIFTVQTVSGGCMRNDIEGEMMEKQKSVYNLLQSLYPWDLLHKLGVNGKVSGSIDVAAKMENVVCFLHGPKGCAFSYRLTAHRRRPYPELYASDLEEKDVIFGSVKKLETCLRQVWQERSPGLIFLVHTPVSDILNEDVESVVRRLQREGIPVIHVKSSHFSHREQGYSSKRLKLLSQIPAGERKPLEISLKGCGMTEAMEGLVDQLMEPCEKEEKTINLEIFGLKGEKYQAVPEFLDMLERFGIQLNCILPGDSLANIRKAPAASLNIVSRLNWAEHMKKRFGTEYLHFRSSADQYLGWDGICLLYRNIFDALGMETEAYDELRRIEEAFQKEIYGEKELLQQSSGVLLCRNINSAPREIQLYAGDFRIQLKKIYLLLSEQEELEQEITDETREGAYGKVKATAELYGISLKICKEKEEFIADPIFQNAKMLLNAGDAFLEGYGVPLIEPVSQDITISYQSYNRAVRKLVDRIREKKVKNQLWLRKIGNGELSGELYMDRDSAVSRKIWSEMWNR